MRATRSVATVLAIFFCASSAQAFDCLEKAANRIKSGDDAAAIEVVKRGARQGDERCKFILGMWSLTGAKAEQNPREGLRWLREAANDGLPIAQSSLGLLYASGLIVDRNEQKAARLYRKAAEYGDPLGQTALALASFRGVGVEEDRVDAYRWISLAAAQGDERANTYLPTIEGSLTTGELELAKADVAQFQPRERTGERRPSKKKLLRLVGLNRPPGEIERFFGFGGGGGFP
ncbi:MAG: sel1 repeat family protein [Deltaproteobacteria bacterium]|nr:sel1 repeat family protein [Deltaproteobacteria bacterium]